MRGADDGSVADEGDGGGDCDDGEEPHDLLLRRLEIGWRISRDCGTTTTSLAVTDDGSVADEGDGGGDCDDGEEPHDLLLRRLEIGWRISRDCGTAATSLAAADGSVLGGGWRRMSGTALGISGEKR
ncbi:uncharacterized protein A4U43_C04F23860 [Asparagus officinalis]|uniref:Uncharacterized protein n=1 Tax=Asparagus officinalis TaxID=4686 RepID=A0A5P1F384_ASPOF|nr:uncharacterized protein A4U43_C04F23860 [Asparagus officinalis]